MLNRRRFVQALGAATLAAGKASATTKGLQFGPAIAFSHEALKAQARAMAQRPYEPPPRPDPEIVQRLNYDAHGKLHFRYDFALWGEGGGAYPITFQHVGRYFPKTVRMFAVDGGQAREILYSRDYFTIAPDSPAAALPAESSAFAGFWAMEARDGPDWKLLEPWVTFLGASYFRAIGELGQVGMSARGVALTPGAPGPEEFPDFIAHWIEPAATDGDPVILHSLLDSPSLTGAYRFALHRTQSVLMEIEADLNLRAPIERLGIAPLTSMFWYSETLKPTGIDWRPEIHDSDGLAVWTRAGEHVWRPLNNPPRTTLSSFIDENPRGFGLLQRDREFDHYQDGVKYHLRPSTWVEPLGNWGRGAVQLLELPTDDEIHDNICASWVSDEPTRAGQSLNYTYRLHWLADEPFPSPLARVVATRLGRGGQPGQPRPKGVRKFMVEFWGAPLRELPYGVKPEPVVTTSRGTFGPYQFTEPVPDDLPGHWRTQFDLIVDGTEPIELRCFLKLGDRTLSETWAFQYHPF
jgi:periplasmic glucans biosynthesis protein